VIYPKIERNFTEEISENNGSDLSVNTKKKLDKVVDLFSFIDSKINLSSNKEKGEDENVRESLLSRERQLNSMSYYNNTEFVRLVQPPTNADKGKQDKCCDNHHGVDDDDYDYEFAQSAINNHQCYYSEFRSEDGSEEIVGGEDEDKIETEILDEETGLLNTEKTPIERNISKNKVLLENNTISRV
jgi:hypothetical protein